MSQDEAKVSPEEALMPQDVGNASVAPNDTRKGQNRSKKWRFFRRWENLPNFFLCRKIDLAIYIAIIFCFIVDTSLIGLWSTYRHLWVQPDDLIYQSEATKLNGELVAIQVFCFVSNICLLFGIRLRFPLLCLSWVTIRLIWFYYAMIAWMRAVNLVELLKKDSTEPIRYDINGTSNPLSSDDLGTIRNISRVVIYSYWPIVIIQFYVIMGITVFIFQIMEANERRRRSTPVGIYIHPTQLRKLSLVAGSDPPQS